MNNLQIMQAPTDATMSSREIATLCNKEHRNVCRDIESLNENYEEMGLLKTEQGYYTHPNTGNQQHREFYLTEVQTIDLITGYNSKLRILINRRWRELESQVKQPFQIPQTLHEALRLSADLAEENAEQKLLLAIVQPKAEALDVINSATGSLGVRQTAKTLGVAQNKFVTWCERHRWMYRDPKKKSQPYSERMKQGYMEQKVSTYRNPDGEQEVTTQAMFTPKGLVKLAERFSIIKELSA